MAGLRKRPTALNRPFGLSVGGTKRIPISRPPVVIDSRSGKRKAVVLFRDTERGSRVSAAVCDDLPRCKCAIRDLAETGVGMWEPAFDQALWNSARILHLFTQHVGQGGGEALDTTTPRMVSILEWKT